MAAWRRLAACAIPIGSGLAPSPAGQRVLSRSAPQPTAGEHRGPRRPARDAGSAGRDRRGCDLADRDQLERGFRRLDVDQRTVLVMHYYLGFSLDEAAEVLGVPPGTVRSRLHRAINAMRAALEADARTPMFTKDGRHDVAQIDKTTSTGSCASGWTTTLSWRSRPT